MSNYTNILYQPGGQTVISYRSNLLTYEESFENGVLASSGYNTAGFPLNVLSNCPTRINHRRLREPSSFNLEINGQNVDNTWKLVDFKDEKTENGHKGIIILENTTFPVSAKVITELDGTQMLTRYIEITNNGDAPLSISRLSVLSGALETMERVRMPNVYNPDEIYDLGYFDTNVWGTEGEFNWHKVNRNFNAFETKYESERYRHPAMFIRNNVMGTMFFAQMAWTGGCRFTVNHNVLEDPWANAMSTILSTSMELSGYKPLMVIMPKETLTTPEVYFGMITGGLDEAVNEMHAHLRRSVFTFPGAEAKELLVGCGMGAEHDMSVETTKSFMRQMKEMGGEIFLIDGGWQCPPHAEMSWYDHNGKNVPDPERYPNGLKELKEYAKSIGLKLGMWMEPERLGRLSPMYAEHPDWFPTNFWGDKNDGFIDLTIPEAAKWVEDEIARVIEEYELDLFRLDHNGCPDYFCQRDVNGVKECENVRLINAVYKMYRNLKKRFPNVIFENCASGGGRTDLGMIKCFNHTWVTDWQRLPRSVEITDGMTLVIPPERVDRLFAGMNSHEIGSLALNMRNTMLGHMSLNVINPMIAEINTDVMDFAKHSVSIYKDFIRPFLPESKIYHHVAEASKLREQGFSATELVSADKKKGVLSVATLTAPKNDVYTIFPKGLDRALTYKVTFDNNGETFKATGYELMNKGIRFNIPAALMSELVLFDAE